MARILFTVPPLTGHLNPALAVASVLKQQGHELAWAVHARQIGGKLPQDARIYPLDREEAAAANADLAAESARARGLESVRLFFEDYAIPLAREALAPLEAAVRDFKPDFMVVDHQMVGGALVARKWDLPWVTLITTSASILSFSATIDGWVEAQYRGLQEGYLPEEKIVARPDFSPWRNIVFSVEALVGTAHPRVAADYAFVGPTRGQGRREVEFPWEWLAPGRRKILVTLGTVSRDRDTRFFELIMEAVAELDLQAILVAPPSLAERAPANVLVRDYVPQLALLPHLHGVVCHAGHNTVCESLAHGLPLVVSPIRDDQPVVARQAVDAGVALFLRHGKFTVATARKTIATLLEDPAYAANAQRIAAAFATAQGAEGAAEVINGLVSRPSRAAEVPV